MSLPDKQNLKKFITTRPTLQEMSKEIKDDSHHYENTDAYETHQKN
jgi:hypothetical protein